jgi:hypothetical protein
VTEVTNSWDVLAERAKVERTSLLSPASQEAVNRLAERVRRRERGALVRNSFVRYFGKVEKGRPPLSLLVGVKGRGGGEVALKLYLALLWLSSGYGHTSELEAGDWAQILDLRPLEKGARRVRKALEILERHQLIAIQRRPGKSNVVRLLRDDGSGNKYSLPKGRGEADRYFSVSAELWTRGLIQGMSAAALAMLLVVLEESFGRNQPQWWSPRVFSERFCISPDTRTKGIKELRDELHLIVEMSQRLRESPGKRSSFTARRRRKAYLLVNEARYA